MKLLVLGSRGQVGHELSRLHWPAGYALAGFDRDDVDITRRIYRRGTLIDTQKYTTHYNAEDVVTCRG